MNWILAGYFSICSGVGMVLGAGSAMAFHVSLPGFILCGLGCILCGTLLIPMRLK